MNIHHTASEKLELERLNKEIKQSEREELAYTICIIPVIATGFYWMGWTLSTLIISFL